MNIWAKSNELTASMFRDPVASTPRLVVAPIKDAAEMTASTPGLAVRPAGLKSVEMVGPPDGSNVVSASGPVQYSTPVLLLSTPGEHLRDALNVDSRGDAEEECPGETLSYARR